MACEKCGHSCPENEFCAKCGGDPMQPGDKLCVDCDSEERDATPFGADGPLAVLYLLADVQEVEILERLSIRAGFLWKCGGCGWINPDGEGAARVTACKGCQQARIIGAPEGFAVK